MSKISRRKLVTTGLAAAAGVSGLAALAVHGRTCPTEGLLDYTIHDSAASGPEPV